MLRIVLTCCCLLFLWASSPAQQARQYAFTHYTTANALASNIVRNVVQDKDGFIWIATINGLQRYDGHSFVTFHAQSDKPSAIPSDNITRIYKDSKNNLWVLDATNRAGIFNTRNFTYHEVPIRHREAKKIYAEKYFLETPDGTLLLHEVYGDLYRYDPALQAFVESNHLIPAPQGWRRSNILWDAAEKKYWASCDSGLVLFDPATRHLSYRDNNTDNNPVIARLQHLRVVHGNSISSRGTYLFVSWPPGEGLPTLHQYNKKDGSYQKRALSKELAIGYHEITGSLEQKNGRLWTFGHPFLAEWTADRSTFNKVPNEYRNEQSIRYDYIYSAYEDKENNIWVCTDNGLYLFNPDAQVFNSYNLIRPGNKASFEAPVQVVMEDAEQKIWVGCWGAGLYLFDQQFNPLPLPASLQPIQNTLSVWDMFQHTKSGLIWIALQSGGLVVYDPATGKTIQMTPDIFEQRTIRQVVEDVDGNLWFATHRGRVVKWDYKAAASNPQKGFINVYTTGMVHKLHADDRGYMWVGTLGHGLLKIDIRTHRLLKVIDESGPPGERLFNNAPTDMTQYNDSTLIVTAGCVNIINTNTNKVTFISTRDGLPSNTAQSVQKDAKGILWLGLVNGLCRLNLENKIVSSYDRRNGIAYDNFTIAGVEKLADGRIVFFTDHNFLVFDPNRFVQPGRPPRPVISSFQLEGSRLLIDSLLSEGQALLNFNNTSIAIEFSVLSFLKQKKPKYFYMLEGIDKDWIHREEANMAIYNYLPPGRFTFRVKSQNEDGISSDGFTTLVIEVSPPFWRTWWFYAIIILLVIGILYLIDTERVKRLRALQSVRAQIAGDLHQEINVTLSDINVLSEIAKIKADNDINRSKDYIDQISTKSRIMIEAMDDMLWSIDPDNDSMQKMLLRMKEFTEGFKRTHGAEIEMIVDKNVEKLVLDMKSRHEFLLFYKEALNYVVQHSICATIYISMEYIKAKVNLKILAECSNLHHENTASLLSREEMERRAGALKGTLDMMADKKSISIILQMGIT